MLLRKTFRDLKNNFGQFFSIFLLTFIAVFLFTGVAGEVAGLTAARKTFHNESVLADLWVYGNDITKEQISELAEDADVQAVQGRIFCQGIDINDSYMFMYFQNENTVNKPKVIEGAEYDPADADSIWLAKRYADEQSIALGDIYTVTAGGKTMTFTVRGLVWSPEYEYYKNEVDLEPDYHDTGYAFASAKIFEDPESYDQIVLKGTSGYSKAFEDHVAEIIDGKFSLCLKRSDITNIKILDDEIEQHKMMSVLFPIFFILVAMLTTVTTMKRIVDRQRTIIGTFKALGLKKKKIYIHYLSYGFFPSLLGTLLGTLLGPFAMSPMLFKMKYYLDSSDEYMMPRFDIVFPWYFGIVGFAIVAICVGAAWFSCKNILMIRPAAALRPAQPKSSKKTIFEKLPFWSDLSFSNRYNLRDISRNKTRTIFGLAGTTSCMGLMLCGFASKDNFQNAVADLYVSKLMNDSAMITISKEVPIYEAIRICDIIDGELIMSDTTEIMTNDDGEKASYHMNVYENGKIANALDEDLNVCKLNDDDFTITQKTAKALGISVGDEVKWHIYGSDNWSVNKVTKIVWAPFEQGIVTTRTVIENCGYEFTPTRLLSQQDVDDELKKESLYIDSVTSKENMSVMLSNYMELIDLVVGFMLLLAVLLAVIVLYSLGLLSFEERLKELATLKVLGFGAKKLRNLMLQQNVILAVIGAFIGIPVGRAMLGLLVDSLGDSMDIPAACELSYICISFFITVFISVVVDLLFTGQLKNMNMVEEIKNTE